MHFEFETQMHVEGAQESTAIGHRNETQQDPWAKFRVRNLAWEAVFQRYDQERAARQALEV